MYFFVASSIESTCRERREGGDGTSDKLLQNGLRGDMTMPGIVEDGLKRDVGVM